MVDRANILLSKFKTGILLAVSLLLAACQRQNEIQLTLIAQNATLQSEIGAVRQTATVDAERLQITVDYMGTLIGRAEEQRALLQATLVARGTDPSNIAPQFNTPFPTPGGVNPNPALVPMSTPEQTEIVQETTTPALVNYTIASGVGNDDCAINNVSTFTTADSEIYVVATGENIASGTNIAARFSVGGQEIRHDFTPDFDIDGACVWFFIDQNDLEFRPGTWSVQLELNGVSASPPIPFTITGDEGG